MTRTDPIFNSLEVSVESMAFKPDAPPLIGNLAFDVKPGQVVALLGRSGAGKTTLLRIVAGLERRFSGTVKLGGQLVTEPSRRIQKVFQDNRLLPWKTVAGNLRFVLLNGTPEEKDQRIGPWLDRVGLNHVKETWPKYLSGGEESRVALIRAFLEPPDVLLLDEPFRGLDAITKIQVQETLIAFLSERQIPVVMTAHDVGDAIFLSDTIYVLQRAPLRVMSVIHVDVPRPRERTHPRLFEIEASVLETLKTVCNAERATAVR